MLDWTEIMLRLGIATLAGGLIGLNRDLHGKPIGLKTLSLVSLATAMLLVMVHSDESKIVSDAGSRVIQGILTGIGLPRRRRHCPRRKSFPGSRAHQRRLHLAGGLHRNCLRPRTMATGIRRIDHHLRGLDRWRPN